MTSNVYNTNYFARCSLVQVEQQEFSGPLASTLDDYVLRGLFNECAVTFFELDAVEFHGRVVLGLDQVQVAVTSGRQFVRDLVACF